MKLLNSIETNTNLLMLWKGPIYAQGSLIRNYKNTIIEILRKIIKDIIQLGNRHSLREF